jgi:hypothetical protein
MAHTSEYTLAERLIAGFRVHEREKLWGQVMKTLEQNVHRGLRPLRTWEMKAISAGSVPVANHFVRPASFRDHMNTEINADAFF